MRWRVLPLRPVQTHTPRARAQLAVEDGKSINGTEELSWRMDTLRSVLEDTRASLLRFTLHPLVQQAVATTRKVLAHHKVSRCSRASWSPLRSVSSTAPGAGGVA